MWDSIYSEPANTGTKVVMIRGTNKYEQVLPYTEEVLRCAIGTMVLPDFEPRLDIEATLKPHEIHWLKTGEWDASDAEDTVISVWENLAVLQLWRKYYNDIIDAEERDYDFRLHYFLECSTCQLAIPRAHLIEKNATALHCPHCKKEV